MRISTRISLHLTVLAIVVFGVIAVWQLVRERDDLEHAVEREMRLVGRTMRVAIEHALRDRQLEDVEDELGELDRTQPDVDLLLVGPDGSIRASSEGAEQSSNVALATVERMLVDGSGQTRFELSPEGRFAILAVPCSPAVAGSVTAMALVRSMEDVREDLIREEISVVASFVAFALLAGLLAWLMGELYVARPLLRLSHAMERLRVGDFRPPSGPQRNDEVGRILRDFHTTADELSRAKERLEQEQTAHRRSQRALQEADRLVTVGQLSAGLAHEIGSPLQVLQGRARRVLKHPHDLDEVVRNCEIICSQAERITRIVEQLLNFARRKPPRIDRMEPVAAIRAVLDLLQLEAKRASVKLELVSSNVPSIHTDGDQLQQIVLNLVRNALQATPDGGSVQVFVQTGTVTQRADKPAIPGVRIVVEDSGSGISEEIRVRMFEPFFTTRAGEGGSGLGLAIVRSLVSDLGGHIQVSTDIGKGSRFIVDLPADRDKAGEAA